MPVLQVEQARVIIMTEHKFVVGDRVHVTREVECGFPCGHCVNHAGYVESVWKEKDPAMDLVTVHFDQPVKCQVGNTAKYGEPVTLSTTIGIYACELAHDGPPRPPADRIDVAGFQKLF